MNVARYRKLIVALGGLATAVALRFGLDVSDLVSAAVEAATAALVFVVPNAD